MIRLRQSRCRAATPGQVSWDRWLAPLVIWAIVLGVRAIAAQDPPDTKSSMSGIFTAEQADKGRGVFSTLCVGCHTVASHTGIQFKKRWNGETVWDLFDTIKETMPDDDPGSVKTEDVTVIVAFLLSANGMPPGKVELKPDADVLKKIKIEVPEKTFTVQRSPFRER